MTEQSDHEKAFTSFASLLNHLEDGELVSDLSKSLREVISAIEDHKANTGKAGKGDITIKLHFTADEGVIDVKSDVTTKVPKEVRRRTTLWATPNNYLSPYNPRQQEMFSNNGLRTVTSPNSGPRSV